MPRSLAALLALALLGLGAPARSLPFSATLGFSVEGALRPVVFDRITGAAIPGAGDSLEVDGHVPYVYGQYLSGASFVVYVVAFADLFAGTLAPSKGPAGGFGGNLPLRLLSTGFLLSNLYDPVCFGLGFAGRTQAPSSCGGYGTLVEVTGWTTGNLTLTGANGTTLRARGSDARTPGGRGNLLLVTPIRVSGGLHPSPRAGFGTLSLAIVPEPGTLALCAAGALGLAALGRQRALRRRG